MSAAELKAILQTQDVLSSTLSKTNKPVSASVIETSCVPSVKQTIQQPFTFFQNIWLKIKDEASLNK
jgi:hypothetical protein